MRARTVVVVLLSACSSPPPVEKGLPCDVAALVSAKCLECHGSPLDYSAPVALYTREHFAAKSTVDPSATFAQRSVTRIKDANNPMPPPAAPQLTAAEKALFEKWVTDGLPTGTCEPDLDGGLPIDAGPPPLTCLSGQKKPRPTTTAPGGEDGMAPGWACSACHRGVNFEGQNPFGALGMTAWYDAMGTVYAAPHEEDLCISTLGPDAGVTVEIYDSTGARVLSLPLLESGNFYGSVAMDAGVRMPYTAKVVRGALSRTMTTPQTDGDCNTCHTPYGREGAPGRIQAP
jgi:hypothetical protein